MNTHLTNLCKLIRYFILVSTTEAGSGHPTSSLSAVELMTTLLFNKHFHYDLENPKNPDNDRLIFSKGHASPLFYVLWGAAGKVTEDELKTLRQFDSPLEGHPSIRFPYTEAATGSLGQGLSIGVGMALNAKIDNRNYKTVVLLGDSEMAEGSNWEAIELAAYYKLNNLIGILDVNRLGQRGETMFGHDVDAYEKRVSAFGWNTIVVDGHNIDEIENAYQKLNNVSDRPTMIIAKTIKGKGVTFLEDKNGWHGKALPEEDLKKALGELGEIDKNLRGEIEKPEILNPKSQITNKFEKLNPNYKKGDMIATRKAYGNALFEIGGDERVVALDPEVDNSTYANKFGEAYKNRYFETFIAEQNAVGVALGLALRGKVPFIATFAAFWTRAFDQIRMTQYSKPHIIICGSHAGVSIGQDGFSQMGLEDIGMMRSIRDAVILYPSDATSTERVVELAYQNDGIVYIRTTRMDTPVLYENDESFEIGKSKTLRSSDSDAVTIVGAGVTLHEALKAYDLLEKEGITVRVIDLFSVKPLDEDTLRKVASETKAIITVEDHSEAGGIGEAVMSLLCNTNTPVYSLCVRKTPRSGTPEELLEYEEISADAIVKKVKEIL